MDKETIETLKYINKEIRDIEATYLPLGATEQIRNKLEWLHNKLIDNSQQPNVQELIEEMKKDIDTLESIDGKDTTLTIKSVLKVTKGYLAQLEKANDN